MLCSKYSNVTDKQFALLLLQLKPIFLPHNSKAFHESLPLIIPSKHNHLKPRFSRTHFFIDEGN